LTQQNLIKLHFYAFGLSECDLDKSGGVILFYVPTTQRPD
jgi:hypothetical protein